jgi:hypothetical protein
MLTVAVFGVGMLLAPPLVGEVEMTSVNVSD